MKVEAEFARLAAVRKVEEGRAAALRQHHGEQADDNENGRVPANWREPRESRRQRESTEKAARVVGTSGRSISRAKRITKEAPDLAAKVTSGELALGRAERIIRDRAAEQKRIEAAKAVDTSGRYSHDGTLGR